MNLTEKQIENHKAWLQDQKPAHQAYVGVLIADKLTAAHPAEPLICKACRSIGVWHCAHPEECGNRRPAEPAKEKS